MSGVISFSHGGVWFINGWGWRQLLERAVRDAGEAPCGEVLTRSLYLQAVAFEPLSPAERRPLAAALLRSAESVADDYETHPGEYERGYAARLRELTELLRREASTDVPG